jgi:hypothetical protein
MFELIIEVYKSLASWPALQFAGIVLGGYVGIKLILRGEKDKKPSTPGNGDATPRWFANEQQLELLRDIKETLHDIKHESRSTVQLLEQIANENVINPRRLQE